jgi:hypothetical protein
MKNPIVWVVECRFGDAVDWSYYEAFTCRSSAREIARWRRETYGREMATRVVKYVRAA